MTAIDRILQSYRDAAVTEREKGSYFERLALAFFINDPVQAEEYEAVWTWSEWAKANGRDGKDVGIDLVAELRNEDGFAAIQAKFYAADTRIQKTHTSTASFLPRVRSLSVGASCWTRPSGNGATTPRR